MKTLDIYSKIQLTLLCIAPLVVWVGCFVYLFIPHAPAMVVAVGLSVSILITTFCWIGVRAVLKGEL